MLLFFTLFGLAVSWRKNLLIVATIATLAGAGHRGRLLVATHDVLPFTFVLLWPSPPRWRSSACLDHWLSERWLAAAAADLSVLLATWLVTNARGLPDTYAPIPHSWLLAAQVALLAIYLASIIVRTLLAALHVHGLRNGAMRRGVPDQRERRAALSTEPWPWWRWSARPPATWCPSRCWSGSGRDRNFYTYSTFGILLALAGSRILLSGDAAAAAWSAVALACIWAGGAFRSLTLQVHGGIYLVLALVFSGAFRQAAAFVLGSADWPGAEPLAISLGALAALMAWLLAVRAESQLFRTAMAAVLAWLGAGIAAGMLAAAYHGIFGAQASHAYCATLRTAILSLAALGLAWAGTRWKAAEWTQLIYPTMALGAWRLVTDDLHQDRKAALFLSLLVYGAVLTILPKLRRVAAT